MLLWLWYRPAAVTLFWPLTWEVPYAASVDLKSKKKTTKTKKRGGGILTFAIIQINFVDMLLSEKKASDGTNIV